MSNKKQTGGSVTDWDSLVSPEDLSADKSQQTAPKETLPITKGQRSQDRLTTLSNTATKGTSVYGEDRDFDSYDEYIDRPFNILDPNVDDYRAEGQSVAEKAFRSYGVKMPVSIFNNVVGSTIGLGVGINEVAQDFYKNGPSSEGLNKFFNNDFQKSLDSINEHLNEKLPNYYTSYETQQNILGQAFGSGAANFWTDGLANGLSFVAGAVISEYLTAGLGGALAVSRAGKMMKQAAIKANKGLLGQKGMSGLDTMRKVANKQSVYDGLRSARQLATGAFYESGVEARHNYDETLEKLKALYAQENPGTPISEAEEAKMHNIAVKTSNGVFAANAALVGYSNMLMFPRIFGKGMRTANKNYKNKIIEDIKDGARVYKEAYKDFGKFRNIGRHAYAMLKRPLYEGFVEEGGQGLANLSGQEAAEYFYTEGKDPGNMEAIGAILNHTDDAFAQAYGGYEGQKEIFLGFILGGLGLPSFVKTDPKTGEKKYGMGWNGFSAVEGWNEIKTADENVSTLVKAMNENPDAAAAVKANFDNLVRQKNANDKRDFSIATNNDYEYKNADHDAWYSYVITRIKAGYYGDIADILKGDIENMSNDEFETQFNLATETDNMSETEREEFLNSRKQKVVESHLERAAAIKEVYEATAGLAISEKYREMLAHAYSSMKDVDNREEMLIKEMEALTGESLEVIEDRPAQDEEDNRSIMQKFNDFLYDTMDVGGPLERRMNASKAGRRVKKRLGIKEFTKPGDANLVAMEMAVEAARLEKEAERLEQEGKDDEAFALLEQIDEVREDLVELTKEIQNGTAPDLSTQEQELLENYRKKDSAGYEQNKEDISNKLKDLRRLRARRHRALKLAEMLRDPNASDLVIQQTENAIQDMLTKEEEETLNPEQKSLSRRYKGKIIEFDYTNKNGDVKTFRVIYKDNSSKGLVRIPSAEDFRLVKRLKALEDDSSPEAQEEREVIQELLDEGAGKYQAYNAEFLQEAANIREITIESINLEGLEASIDILQEGVAADMEVQKAAIQDLKNKIDTLAEQGAEIISAVQNRTTKQGRDYVNLNAIGRRGAFGVEGARAIQAEIEIELQEAEKALEKLQAKVSTLNDNAEKIRTIQGVVDSNMSYENKMEALRDYIGALDATTLFDDLLKDGYFTESELSQLAISNQDGKFTIDESLISELREMVASNNLSDEYFDLINSDLDNLQTALKNLKIYKESVVKALDEVYDPATGQLKILSEEGETQGDVDFLLEELKRTQNEIAALEDAILTEAAGRIGKKRDELDKIRRDIEEYDKRIPANNRAIELENQVLEAVNSFHEYLQEVMTPPAAETKEESDKEPDTRDAQEADANIEERDFNFAPSVLELPFLKTAGSHVAALNTIEELESRDDLTPQEALRLKHAQSQARFYKATEEMTDWSKKTGNKLLVITKNNVINAELSDDIIFYDSVAKKDNFRTVADLIANDNTELDDIKVVLVDANLEPVQFDGGIAYTSLPNAELFDADGRYRYASDKDLKEDGTPKEAVLAEQERYQGVRAEVMTVTQPVYTFIKGKAKGVPILSSDGPGGVLHRVVDKEQDIQHIDLKVATKAKAKEESKRPGGRAVVNIGGKQWSVKNGFIYMAEGSYSTTNDSKGVRGNLVKGSLSTLTDAQQQNVYNLLRLFATNDLRVKAGEVSKEDVIHPGNAGKGVQAILKDIIFFGKSAKGRTLTEYSIYFENDTVVFGDKYISFQDLAFPEKAPAINGQFREFLGTLLTHVNANTLDKDSKARSITKKENDKKRKKAKGKKYNKSAVEYDVFTEVIVADDLTVDTKEWNNYTEFLLSGAGRDKAEIPVKVDMRTKSDGQKNAPQYKNMYMKHEISGVNALKTAEQMDDIAENSKKSKPDPYKDDTETTVNESGEIVEVSQEPLSDEEFAEVVAQVQGAPENITFTVNETIEFEGKTYQPGDSFTINVPNVVDAMKPGLNEYKVNALHIAILRHAGIEVPSIAMGASEQESISESAIQAVGGENNDGTQIPGEKKLKFGQTGEDTSFEEDEEDDSPFMLDRFATQPDINLDAQLTWFNANMPTDVISLEFVRGLIDNKGIGKFTKDSKILLSDMMNVDGVIYHEAYHAITLRYLTAEQRLELYNEVRARKGKSKTFKGEMKNLSEFTDKEADEWLAEEFREYVLTDGAYKVGQRVKKSFIQRAFDKLLKLINFFSNPSQVDTLFANINNGYYANPTSKVSLLEVNSEAYMEMNMPSPTLINNAMEGMTSHLFQLAAARDLFTAEDFFSKKKAKNLSEVIVQLYGRPGEKNKVYNKVIGSIGKQIKLLEAMPTTPGVRREIEKLKDTRVQIRDNWSYLIKEHGKYLQKWKINIDKEIEAAFEENKGNRDSLHGIASHEIDPNSVMPLPLKLLLSTLPKSYVDSEGVSHFEYNTSGLPRLADFGNTMAYLYNELAGLPQDEILPKLMSLRSAKKEINFLIERLGLDSDIKTLSGPKIKLLTQFIMQFNQSNNEFLMNLISRDGSKTTINSNSDRVYNQIKRAWELNFKDVLRAGVGKMVKGKLIVNIDKKVFEGKSIKEWSTTPMTGEQARRVLSVIGIKFSNVPAFIEEYESNESVSDAVMFVLQEIAQNPDMTAILEGDIQANVNTLVEAELEHTIQAIDLQHRTPEGKNAFGITLKTSMDNIAEKYNASDEAVENALEIDNYKGSYWLRSKAENSLLEFKVSIIEGAKENVVGGKAKHVSKTSPSDIAALHSNLILQGTHPVIRTADKKTEYAFSLDGLTPDFRMSEGKMVNILKGYLADEIRLAGKQLRNPKSKLNRIKGLDKQGKNLRFFNGLISIPTSQLKKATTDDKIRILANEYNKDILAFLEKETFKNFEALKNLGVIQEIQEGNFVDTEFGQAIEGGKYKNIGLDTKIVKRFQQIYKDKNDNGVNINMNTAMQMAQQLTYLHLIGVNEQAKLLLGDLALYTDLFKRTSGVSGTKTYPTSNAELLSWMNENMPNLGHSKDHSDKLTVAHRADVLVDSPYLEKYKAAVLTLDPSANISALDDAYSNMEEFDGGGFIHLDTYRSLLWRTGKWSEEQENVYQKLMLEEDIAPEEIALLPPLKPQVFAPFIEDNVELRTFHKFALFPLMPQLMPDSAYKEINDDMTANNIDYMIFESVVKVGGVKNNNGEFDAFYENGMYKPMELDENGIPLNTQTFDFSELGIQLEIAPKTKEQVTMGVQSTALLPINIYENGKISERYAKHEGFNETINDWHSTNEEIIRRDLADLKNRLGIKNNKLTNVTKFKNVLLEELERRDTPKHTMLGISALLEGDTKFINQLFEKNKIETLLYAVVTNNVVRRKMPGDLMVLQASTGLESQTRILKQNDAQEWARLGLEEEVKRLKVLKFYEPGEGKTTRMQVFVPHKFKELVGRQIDVNDPAIDPELKNIIGFRIPTEGLNSIDAIEIAGFLPQQFGSTIMVPTEMVGKAGSDYDIDKITLYFPNYVLDTENNAINKVKYLDDSNSTAKERLEVMKENREVSKDMKLSEFSKLSLQEQNIKAALQNRAQDLMADVLLHPESFDQLITPVGAFEVKDIADEIRVLRNGGKAIEKKNFSQMLTFENMVNQSYRMWSGLGGTGIVATSATAHGKAQRVGLKISNEAEIELNFAGFDSSNNKSLARVKDIEGRRSINSVLAEYISGYVDVTKDDFVFDINAGVSYAPIHMYLLRSGVPIKSVLYFMSQPVIDDYVKLKETRQSMAANVASNKREEEKAYLSNKQIISKLESKYGKIQEGSRPVMFRQNLLRDMIENNVNGELSPLEMSYQAQVLADFLRYKEYADNLYLLNNATKYDTSKLKSGSNVMYMQALLKRVQESNFFDSSALERTISSTEKMPNLMSALRDTFDQAPGFFESVDAKQFNTEIKRKMEELAYTLTDPNIKKTEDDVIQHLQKFDSFISSYIVQNTMAVQGREKLSDMIKSMFQGETSLPARILQAKNDPVLKENLLIQEFYPMLQGVVDPSHPEFDIDNLRLFSKKLATVDIDLLSDAFLELKEMSPTLANDILVFSVLQSGFDFSPIAFFQVLPSTEVIDLLKPYFQKFEMFGLEDSIEDIYENFVQNNYHNSSVATPVRVYNNDSTTKAFNSGEMNLRSTETYVTVSMPGGEKTVGSVTKQEYITKLFKLKDVAKDGKGIYSELELKGKKQFLVNAGSAIRKDNAAGLNTLDITKDLEKILDKGNFVLVSTKRIIPPGKYRTPSDGIVEVQGALGSYTRNTIAKGIANSVLGIKGKGQAALEQFAQQSGFDSFADLLKSPQYKEFAEGKYVTLHRVQPVRASYFTKAAEYNNSKNKKLSFKHSTDGEVQEKINEKECK